MNDKAWWTQLEMRHGEELSLLKMCFTNITAYVRNNGPQDAYWYYTQLTEIPPGIGIATRVRYLWGPTGWRQDTVRELGGVVDVQWELFRYTPEEHQRRAHDGWIVLHNAARYGNTVEDETS